MGAHNCYSQGMSLPRAELARTSAPRRFARWLGQRLETPQALCESRGFAAASYWSLTGSLGAGFVVSLFLLFQSGTIWQATVPFTVGWAVIAVFGTIFWFWPFLASYYMYLPLHHLLSPLRTRTGGAIYGALWHACAHCLFLDNLGGAPLSGTLLCPILVGGLWGSWLPTAVAPPKS